jgi:outer membrane lipoprotein-sorting protein
MCLKKIFKIIVFLILISVPAQTKEAGLAKEALKFLKEINEFSSTFLQIQNNDVSEGLISIKGKRLRIEYTAPSNLIFVLKKNKAMYFNKELEEVQYFNPKNTIGEFFIDLFNNDDFLLNSHAQKKEGYFYIQKIIDFDETQYSVKIYFEEKPFQLRKLEIINDIEIITFTLINPNYNPNLNDKIFSLANPLLG